MRITARACEVIPVDGVSLPLPRGQCLHIARNGQVSLFFESLVAFHCNLATAWLDMWAVMRLIGLLDADAEAHGRNSLRDVVVFVAMFRRTKKKTVSAFTSKLLDELSFAILPWLAMHMDRYVMDVYVPNNDTSRPAPALRGPASASKQYITVTPEAVWNLMETANKTGNSLRGAIALASDDEKIGCSASQCDRWNNKLQQMYSARAKFGFLNVRHFNIVADASTHSCQDTLVSLGYTWENNLAVCLTTQRTHLEGT